MKPKVLIIGAGLFGIEIANTISDICSSVHIYEKKDSMFQGASSNNQHRFHIGLHYPRSDETIKQIKESSHKFFNKFSNCIFSIKENYYLIENNSKISSSDFYKKFIDSCNQVDETEIESDIILDNVSGSFLTCEKGISLHKLKKTLENTLKLNNNINVFFDCHNVEEYFKNYDYIINCSYWSAHLTSEIKLKYELCNLVLLEQPFGNKDVSYTVMDGDYPSMYRTENKDVFTLSSVLHTPFFKTNCYNEFLSNLNNINKNFNMNEVNNKIIEHGEEYFKLKNKNIVGHYTTPKIKLEYDYNEKRTTEIIFDKKYITILQGKISTINSVSEKIFNYIKQNGEQV